MSHTSFKTGLKGVGALIALSAVVFVGMTSAQARNQHGPGTIASPSNGAVQQPAHGPIHSGPIIVPPKEAAYNQAKQNAQAAQKQWAVDQKAYEDLVQKKGASNTELQAARDKLAGDRANVTSSGLIFKYAKLNNPLPGNASLAWQDLGAKGAEAKKKYETAAQTPSGNDPLRKDLVEARKEWKAVLHDELIKAQYDAKQAKGTPQEAGAQAKVKYFLREAREANDPRLVPGYVSN